MKNEKQTIQVRRYAPGKNHFSSKTFELVETIRRKVWAEQIGNFNPLFCRYKGANPANVRGQNSWLVNSDAGDVSDPFRADASFLETLFIELPNPAPAKPPRPPVQTIFSLSTSLASFLVNGDESGITAEDAKAVRHFLADHGLRPADCASMETESIRFALPDGPAPALRGEVADFLFLTAEEPRPRDIIAEALSLAEATIERLAPARPFDSTQGTRDHLARAQKKREEEKQTSPDNLTPCTAEGVPCPANKEWGGHYRNARGQVWSRTGAQTLARDTLAQFDTLHALALRLASWDGQEVPPLAVAELVRQAKEAATTAPA